MPTESAATTPAYLWLDTEFTGLEINSAHLLQIAAIITDTHLHRLTPATQDLSLCIRLDANAPVSAWVEEHLTDLLAQCRSEQAVSLQEADTRLAQLLDSTLGPPAREIKLRPILAGNTIHMDAALTRRLLPEFSRRLHYRLLDVSTLKILWQDWMTSPAFDKENMSLIQENLPAGFEIPPARAHDAYYDIHASLAEMNYYRRQLSAHGLLQ